METEYVSETFPILCILKVQLLSPVVKSHRKAPHGRELYGSGICTRYGQHYFLQRTQQY